MENFNGKILQVINEGITIKDLLNTNLIKKIDEEFENANVTPIRLTFIIEEEQKAAKLINLVHKNDLQTKNKQLIVDVEDPNDLRPIINCIGQQRGE